jgi:UDP-4-amino-4,6-dideoxy-N-acetyl-beta-L-altrosamine transaminase
VKKIINYGRHEVTEDDIAEVVKTLKSDYLTQGPVVQEFENAFREQVSNSDYALAVSNATAGLHLACLALDLKAGKTVLTASNTFVASANCVRFTGADVKFVDIDPKTLCMDLNSVEDILRKSKPGAIAGVIPVDFAGYPVSLDSLRTLTDKYGLWIIEDSCHAPGAKYLGADGQWYSSGSGVHSDISVFSFHPVKHIATGEGGMVTTRSAKLAQLLKSLRSHGITREPSELPKNCGGWYYEMQALGYNYRLADINCALGLSQVRRFRRNVERRRQIADAYRTKLADLPIQLPTTAPNIQHAYHLFVIQTPERRQLYEFLRERGIYTQVHYIPVHTQPYYKSLYGAIDLPHTESYYNNCLSLPMYHSMKDSDVDFTVDCLREFYAGSKK